MANDSVLQISCFTTIIAVGGFTEKYIDEMHLLKSKKARYKLYWAFLVGRYQLSRDDLPAMSGTRYWATLFLKKVRKQKKPQVLSTCGFMVGAAGFEPTTSCSQSRRDTGLRYAPKKSYCGERGIRTPGTVSRTAV